MLTSGTSFLRTTDVELGGLNFTRVFNSDETRWGGAFEMEGVPTPFGTSITTQFGLEWTHEAFAFVHDMGALWVVHEMGGGVAAFAACNGVRCSAASSMEGFSIGSWLEKTAAGFRFHRLDGTTLVFESGFPTQLNDGGFRNSHYFLTKVLDAKSALQFEVTYADPLPGQGCLGIGPNNSAGVPYVSTLRGPEGTLVLKYAKLPNATQKSECIIRSVSLKQELADGGSSLVPAVTFSYAMPSAGERSGRITEVQHSGWAENYSYDATTMVRTVGGVQESLHRYANGGSSVVTQAQGRGWDVTFRDGGVANCQPGSDCCGSTLNVVQAVDVAAGRGDGTTASAGMVTTYEINPKSGYGSSGLVYRTIDSCTAPGMCSPGSTQNEWTCATPTTPAQQKAFKDKRGNWTAYTWASGSAAGGVPQPELKQVASGATDKNGTSAMRGVDFGYAYGDGGVQLPISEERPSILGAGKARTATVYDLSSNTPKATIVSGWTKSLNAGVWTVGKKFYATFTRNRQTVPTVGPVDPLGRTLEVEGPCEVASETAIACATGGAPLTQYFYYPANAGMNKSNQLQKVRRWTARVGNAYLDTQYLAYDVWGNITQLIDEAGIAQTLLYEAKNLVSRTVAGFSPLLSGYHNNRPASLKLRTANSYEVYCYRKGTGAAGCVGGTLTRLLQWQARAADAAGANWSERVEFEYWPDDTQKTATYSSWNGTSSVELRKVVNYAADAQHRPTFTEFGNAAGKYSSAKRFDAADNLEALGHPYNSPPPWCLAPNSANHDSNCAQYAYDRLNQLVSVDEYPASVVQRTVFSYDVHGNLVGMKNGCGASQTYITCPAPATTYEYDDFANVIAAKLPTATQPTRYQYDAVGNLVLKETATMRAAAQYVAFAYDSLSRRLNAKRIFGGGNELLYEFVYDVDGSIAAPTDCVDPAITPLGYFNLSPATARTKGRLRLQRDSFGQTWYRYDAEGRVLSELRIRAGNTACSVSPQVNPHTHYQYNADGNLIGMTYPYGRKVVYKYGLAQLAHRISSVQLTSFDGTNWVAPFNIITNVAWEPYGQLRGYRLTAPGMTQPRTVEYALGDNSETDATCKTAAPSLSSADGSGRLRALRVSAGGVALGQGSGNIYQKRFKWQGDQIVKTDACALGATVPVTETYAYDRTLRLTTAGRGGQNVATAGGAFQSLLYGYDARGNRTSESDFTLISATGDKVDQLLSSTHTIQPSLQRTYNYDVDGRVTQLTTATLPRTGAKYPLVLGYGQSANVATDTVFKSVSVQGANWSYYYDALGRRRAKVDPLSKREEFFYNNMNQLLVDNSAQGGTDEYVWLGGRAVAVFRSMVTAGVRASDASLNCVHPRDDVTKCGLRFIVSDVIGKAVLTLDAAGSVAGVFDYQPFGFPNRVTLAPTGTSHPYTVGNSTLADFTHPAGTGLTVQQRVLFPVVETNVATAWASLVDGSTGTALPGGNIGGTKWRYWTPWVQPSAGRVKVNFTASVGATLWGAATGAYEYRRFQPTAVPFDVPLRFPGQYFDTETELFENWNRYYDASLGKYLSPEPLLQSARWTRRQPKQGFSTPAYSYARNNPLRYIDRNGLDATADFPWWIPITTAPWLPEIIAGGAVGIGVAAAGAGVGAIIGIGINQFPDPGAGIPYPTVAPTVVKPPDSEPGCFGTATQPTVANQSRPPCELIGISLGTGWCLYRCGNEMRQGPFTVGGGGGSCEQTLDYDQTSPDEGWDWTIFP